MRALLSLLTLTMCLATGCKILSPTEQEANRLEARYQHMLEEKQQAQEIATIRAHYRALGVRTD